MPPARCCELKVLGERDRRHGRISRPDSHHRTGTSRGSRGGEVSSVRVVRLVLRNSAHSTIATAARPSDARESAECDPAACDRRPAQTTPRPLAWCESIVSRDRARRRAPALVVHSTAAAHSLCREAPVLLAPSEGARSLSSGSSVAGRLEARSGRASAHEGGRRNGRASELRSTSERPGRERPRALAPPPGQERPRARAPIRSARTSPPSPRSRRTSASRAASAARSV